MTCILRSGTNRYLPFNDVIRLVYVFISLNVDQYTLSLSTFETIFHTCSGDEDISRVMLMEVANTCGNATKAIAINTNITAGIIGCIFGISLYFFISVNIIINQKRTRLFKTIAHLYYVTKLYTRLSNRIYFHCRQKVSSIDNWHL